MSNILKSMRLHIGIFGKRNVGKSSLLNFITEQNISIVSDIAGTTTDVVEKIMELSPIGSVVFIDTAGIDDTGKLGAKRIEKTFSVINKIDIALIVCDYNGINKFEENLIKEFQHRNTPFAVIINKNDINEISEDKISYIKSFTENILSLNTKNKIYLDEIKNLIVKIMPEGFFDEEKILDDIIEQSDIVINVVPIDKEAPKGRLILPQVRVIRNILDKKAVSIVTPVEELKNTINSLKIQPKLVITDSQVFNEVSKIVPNDIFLTSYSIAFARLKGDLKTFIKGAEKISQLQDNDKILICESCTHRSSCEDIGRVKIPNLIQKFTDKNLNFEFCSGSNFPKNISDYALIIHCGGCMTNKKEILSRILLANQSNVPITNYGISIAYCLEILPRATKCFLK